MNLMRKGFDYFYDIIKPAVFFATKKNPEIAHELFAWSCRVLHGIGLEKFVLNNKYNKKNSDFVLVNAAGFNRNGEIPPNVLKFFGFDRAIVGTVTGEKWKGNDRSEGYYGRQRIIRFPETNSMVNWLEVPGVGAKRVAENLWKYGPSEVPITISLMPTPNKKNDAALMDLRKTVVFLGGFPNVDRFELNISCPNTANERGILEARDMVEVMHDIKYPEQELDVKVSPNLSEREIDDILDVLDITKIRALTTTNSTIEYDPEYIIEDVEKGGASGDAVYADSLRVQRLFYEKIKGTGLKLNACGGISSVERVKKRLEFGAREIQILTPFIFYGPKLLRSIKKHFSNL